MGGPFSEGVGEDGGSSVSWDNLDLENWDKEQVFGEATDLVEKVRNGEEDFCPIESTDGVIRISKDTKPSDTEIIPVVRLAEDFEYMIELGSAQAVRVIAMSLAQKLGIDYHDSALGGRVPVDFVL